MKKFRLLCWIWIVAATLMILFSAPVSVTYRRFVDSEKDDPITKTEWIGPFGSPRPYIGKALKSSLDLSRLIVALFAVNFLPALVLWKHHEIVRWQEKRKQPQPSYEDKEGIARNQQRAALAFAKILLVAILVVVGAGIYVIVSSLPKSNPATASNSVTPPAARVTSGAALPPGFVIENATPTPVRRAVSVNQ